MEISDSSIWLIAGGVLLFLEFTAAPAIGLLFLGIGALVTGFLLGFGVVDTVMWQWIIFLASTVISAVLLWKPMKNWRTNHNKKFSDMRGDKVEVLENLNSGETGSAKWNGAAMKARLAEGAEAIEKGKQAEIVDIEGNVLIVK